MDHNAHIVYVEAASCDICSHQRLEFSVRKVIERFFSLSLA
jgi:hypothetical protein